MITKLNKQDKSVELRKSGKSIKSIARELNISKSTASLWCRGIKLSPIQIEKLRLNMIAAGLKGRLLGAKLNHDKRLKRLKDAKNLAIEKVGNLTDRDIMIAFTALYWGEGSKKRREFAIVNSDPEMIKFSMKCIRQIWKISGERFAPSIMINNIHNEREEEIKNYWSNITNIPKNQFRKTTFIKSKNKKVYKNHLVHYGTLTIKIKKSIDIYYQLIGLIESLEKGI